MLQDEPTDGATTQGMRWRTRLPPSSTPGDEETGEHGGRRYRPRCNLLSSIKLVTFDNTPF